MNKLLTLIGLITIGTLLGCATKNSVTQPISTQNNNPTSTNTPVGTPTPTPTLTPLTPIPTPTATTCTTYGNNDSSTSTFVELSQWDTICNEFTITKSTTVTGFGFYSNGTSGNSAEIALYSIGPSVANEVYTLGGGGGSTTSAWINASLTPGYYTISPGTYALVLQSNGGTEPIYIGISSSSCASLSFNSNGNYSIYSNSAPWDWLNGDGALYSAATQGTICYEMNVTTCP